MKAYIITYFNEKIISVVPIEISKDYNGDVYSNEISFVIGSNQTIITEDDNCWFII
jgi:hypothetical protein